MQFEPHQFDEQKNPNIPANYHPLKDLMRGSSRFIAILLVLWLILEVIIKLLPYIISLPQEQAWFGSSITDVLTQNSSNSPELQQLANELAQKMGLPENLIHVRIGHSQEINAYATLGGYVVIQQGLLNALPDEESVAAVLAHEIAHIKHRDPLRASARSLLLTLSLSLISGSDKTSQLISIIENTRYSRALETAADEAAVHALAKHYGQVNGMITLFHTLQQQPTLFPSVTPTWLSTHPDTQQRLAQVHRLAQKHHYPIHQQPNTPSQNRVD